MAVKAIITPACNYIPGESRLVLISSFALGNVSEYAAFKLDVDSQVNERLKNIEKSRLTDLHIG